jgi:hypothetical protein
VRVLGRHFKDLCFVREFMFRKERYLATTDAETVLLQVDARLMRLEHVESEKKIDISALSEFRFISLMQSEDAFNSPP